jgi:hypothetical protein
MKTKNQTELSLLELAVTKAANEDGITPAAQRDGSHPDHNLAWSPKEVWRTRVKTQAQFSHSETAPA